MFKIEQRSGQQTLKLMRETTGTRVRIVPTHTLPHPSLKRFAARSQHRLTKPLRLHRWYWRSATVLVLGTVSMLMLIWTTRLLQKQRAEFAMANAIMDLQIRVAEAHLWLEEMIG